MAVVGCVVWAAQAAAAMPSHRSARVAPARSVVLRSSFKLVTSTAVSTRLWTSGSYVLLENSTPTASGPSKGWRVINDGTENWTAKAS